MATAAAKTQTVVRTRLAYVRREEEVLKDLSLSLS